MSNTNGPVVLQFRMVTTHSYAGTENRDNGSYLRKFPSHEKQASTATLLSSRVGDHHQLLLGCFGVWFPLQYAPSWSFQYFSNSAHHHASMCPCAFHVETPQRSGTLSFSVLQCRVVACVMVGPSHPSSPTKTKLALKSVYQNIWTDCYCNSSRGVEEKSKRSDPIIQSSRVSTKVTAIWIKPFLSKEVVALGWRASSSHKNGRLCIVLFSCELNVQWGTIS